MSPLVVLLVLASAAYGSVVPALWAQPAHHPALVLDPHGRPLDTAEVISARTLHLQAKALEGHHGLHEPLVSLAPALVAAPAAVSHQSRVDVHSSPAVIAHSLYSGHHGHWLKKRSLAHIAYAAPVVQHAVYAAPAAVSHQSRVDIRTSPTFVSHAVAAPVVSHAVVAAPAVYAAPAAVSHQSRVDFRSSPALVSHVFAAPVVGVPHLGAHSLYSGHHGHWLKKRSLAHIAYAAPVVSHAVYAAPAAVSHQSRVDVRTSPAVLAHTVLAAPTAHLSHNLLHSAPYYHSSPLLHAW